MTSVNHATSVNRRQWMQLASTGIACASLSMVAKSAVAQPQDSQPVVDLKTRIYKGVKGGRKKGESIQDFFERLKGLGFDGVESGNVNEAADYQTAAEKTGIMVHGKVCRAHWGVRFSDPDAGTRAKATANLQTEINEVYKLGGSSVLVVPGKVNGPNETHDDVWNRSIDSIRPVLPLASRLGIRILIETVWNGFCESPDKFRDYVDAFNSPWVGAYFDIGNMQKFAPADEWIKILGKRTVKLDIKDWGRKPGFCRLGEGDVNWDKVRDELKKISFTGWATREGRDKSLEDTSSLIDQLLLGK